MNKWSWALLVLDAAVAVVLLGRLLGFAVAWWKCRR